MEGRKETWFIGSKKCALEKNINCMSEIKSRTTFVTISKGDLSEEFIKILK